MESQLDMAQGYATPQVTGKSNEGSPDSRLPLTNRLAGSQSPYVRAHMHNPVAWQTWDEEALGLAKSLNRLIFVSIGYAACHWCHVMERESFESEEVANILNNHFIPIKIDREERPDIDAIYMNYVQATTGSGGWPLSVFITPDLEPVFGGTYFPGPGHTSGRLGEQAGFVDVLEKLVSVWREQESRCRDSAKEITRQLREFAEEGVHGQHRTGEKHDGELPEIELLEDAYTHFQNRYDRVNGGFSSAPKFPTPTNLGFLLRLGQWPETVKDIIGEEECANGREMVLHTLRAMAKGGIRDQIGFGFARYSVTKDWSLPHFEKMLYDQAQLLDIYLDAFIITQDPEMLDTVHDIATYLTSTPMAAPQGGFYSAEDADSYPEQGAKEKREGAFYVWTFDEFRKVLGPRDGDILAKYYGVREDGNVARHSDPHDEFISQNTLKMSSTKAALSSEFGIPELEIASILRTGRQGLREYRDTHRPRPALDDKIIVAWNGLAIGALARTAATLASTDAARASIYLQAAVSAAAFIKASLFDPSTQTLHRIYRNGRSKTAGLCDDYAFLIHGLIDLYETTFDDTHLQFAEILQEIQLTRFYDRSRGAFFTTPSPHPPDLLLRLKSGMDNAEPSSNSISARNLHRLSSLLADDRYARYAAETVLAFEAELEQFPHTFAGMLGSVVVGRLGMKGIILVDGTDDGSQVILEKFRGRVRPGSTIIKVGGGTGQWLRERNVLVKNLNEASKSRVFVCEGGVCREGIEHV